MCWYLTTVVDLGGFQVSTENPFANTHSLLPINKWIVGDCLLLVDPGRVVQRVAISADNCDA